MPELKKGGEPSVLDLYKKYFAELFNYGLNVSGDREITADSIHDMFVELHEKNNISDIKEIKPYLFRCLRNIILDSLKKTRYLTQLTDAQEEFKTLSGEDLIIRKEIDEQTSKKLKTAFDGLTPRQKEVVYLRFYNSMNYEQIAAITGISNQSVRNHFSSALMQLRKHMVSAFLLSILVYSGNYYA